MNTEQLPVDEAQMLVDAEARRRLKAANTKIEVAPRIDKDLNAALDRINNLKVSPRQSSTALDARSDKAREHWENANVPKRHREPIGRSETPWQAKFDELSVMLGSGFMITLVGTQGTGKTQMAASLISANCDKCRSSKFATAMSFFIDLKACYDDDSKTSEAAALKAYLKPSFLVLDEMDERSESEWENRMLFHMLNERYAAMKDTLMISRRDAKTFLGSIGHSVQSRLQETGGVVTFNWPSFRAKN